MRVALEGGQAQAVHPHRPVRVHRLRGLCRHLPVEVHPHAPPTPSPRPSAPSSPATTPATIHLHDRRRRLHPLCAVRRPLPHRRDHPRQDRRRHRRRRPPPAHHHLRLRLRHAPRLTAAPSTLPARHPTFGHENNGARPLAKTMESPATRRRQGNDSATSSTRSGLSGLELDLPAGFGVPQGLHRQPPEPLLRDHEQRALPPAPGEGEAPRGQGELHAVPRRAQLLPVHPAHGHRHLLDVLLPAHRGAGLERHLHPADLGDLRPAGAQHAPMGAPTSWCSRSSCTWPGSSTTAPTSRPASSTGSSA